MVYCMYSLKEVRLIARNNVQVLSGWYSEAEGIW